MHLSPDGHRLAATAVAAGLIAVALIAVPGPAVARGPAVVHLGSAAGFAVLAGAGVLATGPSSVRGDVGAYPRPAISDLLDGGSSGSVHRGGAIAQKAQADLADAIAMAARATQTNAAAGDGLNEQTLVAGVYGLSGPSASLHRDLVLDGAGDRDATWIFQVPSDLVTASGSTIVLTNGAQACNVFWQVGGAVTLGRGSSFAGTILATASLTVEDDITLDGRLLTTTGRVSLGGDAIVVPTCTADAAPATPMTAPGPAGDAPVAASVVALGRDERPPSALPLFAVAGLLLATLFGESRRGTHRRRGRR